MVIKRTTGNRIAGTSSKGNQEKWQEDGRWFKLDMFGYEGLAETVTSALLSRTNISAGNVLDSLYRFGLLDLRSPVMQLCRRGQNRLQSA